MPLRIGRRKRRLADSTQPMQRRDGGAAVGLCQRSIDRRQGLVATEKMPRHRDWDVREGGDWDVRQRDRSRKRWRSAGQRLRGRRILSFARKWLSWRYAWWSKKRFKTRP